MSPPREARLKPEFSGLYPDLAAGVWVLAANMAARLAGLAQKDPEADVLRRVLDERHFEFRGGPSTGVPHVFRDRHERTAPSSDASRIHGGRGPRPADN